METYNENTGAPTRQPERKTGGCMNRSGSVMGGLLVVAIGLLLLARRAGLDFPDWLLSFEALLIALGLFLGFRHSFKGVGWIIPIVIGGFLLLDDFYPYFDIGYYFWPLLIIGIGLFIIFSSSKKKRDWGKWDAGSQAYTQNFADDYLDSTVVFGGIKKNVISKNFRGGEAVTVFGGTEINLTQADINGVIVLELTQIFGGTKLIVPSHWKVQSKDLVAIFGGVDDKRPLLASTQAEDTNKVLILKGTCLLGGIDIRSY
ncbi:MAG: hypothetical protein WA874_21900 [Chryseosolibacter sp.]